MPIFGKPPVDPATIAGEIISAVRRTGDIRPTGKWTKTVKNVLRGCAEGHYAVYPNRSGKGEWLLDVDWLSKRKGVIHLAVESEWKNKDHVWDDFQKLLCTKAPLKIMIYYASKRSLVGWLAKWMKPFDHHVRGEHYLLVEFAPGPADRAYLYTVQATDA